MATFLPFCGTRPNSTDARELRARVTPPYDVIGTELQDTLYKQSPHNAVRMILGKEGKETKKEDGDNGRDNVYTRAKDTLKQWLTDDVLATDVTPTFTAYSQLFTGPDGEKVERKGVLGALLIPEDQDIASHVLPHEKTIAKYITDRLTLAQTTLMNMEPIFMISQDPSLTVERVLFDNAPGRDWIEIENPPGDPGVTHKCRVESDPLVCQEITTLFASQTLLIADGHHRWETAKTLKREARKILKDTTGETPPQGTLPTDYLMVFVSNMDDSGLVVYPTHRVLQSFPGTPSELATVGGKKMSWNTQKLEEALLQWFDQADDDDFDRDSSTIRYTRPGLGGSWTLKLKLDKMDEALVNLPSMMRTLDAASLDQVVFEGLFQASAPQLKDDAHLWFYRNEQTVADLLENETAQAVFYLHAPSVHQVKAICEAGHLMPQKSTYFYPKILSGLTMMNYQQPDVIKNTQPLSDNFFQQPCKGTPQHA